MTAQQWEYCELFLGDIKDHGRKGRSYDAWVRYFGSNGVRFRTLAELEGANMKLWTGANPFDQATALLGAAGWELVSYQHGTKGYDGMLVWFHRSAMFKRPVQSGRAVEDFDLAAQLKQ